MSALALSGHRLVQRTCLLSGVKRTCPIAVQMSAFDPKPTFSVALAERLLLDGIELRQGDYRDDSESQRTVIEVGTDAGR